eukprot:3940027-Rhodomonas_salina.1
MTLIMNTDRLGAEVNDFSKWKCGRSEAVPVGSLWRSTDEEEEEEEKLCSSEDAFCIAPRTKLMTEPRMGMFSRPLNVLVQQGIGFPTIPPKTKGTFVTISNQENCYKNTVSTRPQCCTWPLWNDMLQIHDVNFDGIISVAVWKDGNRPRLIGEFQHLATPMPA